MSPPDRELRHPLFARFYARIAGALARHDPNRQTLLSGLSGRVLEVGCGNGANFGLYPDSVSEVLAVEPEPYLRARARRAADDAAVPVEVVDGVAEALPVEDGWCDAVIFSLVLCSVRSQPAALSEAWRVLRAGGELRFYEHVAARGHLAMSLQRTMDRTFWPHAFGNCHLGRDTASAIAAAGFRIERCRRLGLREAEPPLPHILGVALRPEAVPSPPGPRA